MLIFTRNDLAMMLKTVDNNNADNIKLDVNIDCDYNIKYIDFDMYHDTTYIGTVLTLE